MEQNNKKDILLLLSVILIIVITTVAFIVISSPLSIAEYLLSLLFGLPMSMIIAFPWYFLFLTLTFSLLRLNGKYLSREYKVSYVLIISVLAFTIDTAYRQLIWLEGFGKNLVMSAVNVPIPFILILVPMVMYWLLNATLSYTFLGLEKKQSAIIGLIMAFFNTSWLVVVLPFIFGNIIN